MLGLSLVEGLLILIGLLVIVLVWRKTPEEPDHREFSPSMDEGEIIFFPGMLDFE